MFELGERVAVVTGGVGLIGRALVEGLARFGAHVFVADVDATAAEGYAERLRQGGLTATSVWMDIRKVDTVSAAIANVLASAGSLDIWVNCAYPKIPGSALNPPDVDASVWRADIDGHLNGYALSCREAAEAMRAAGRPGSIINLASIYGMVAPDYSVYEGLQMTTPATYAAAKGGIISLTRLLASYYGPHGIRVNCVSPGGISNRQPEQFVRRYQAKTPLGRMGTAEDVVGAVVFLASDAASYVTGHNLVVDGGWTAL